VRNFYSNVQTITLLKHFVVDQTLEDSLRNRDLIEYQSCRSTSTRGVLPLNQFNTNIFKQCQNCDLASESNTPCHHFELPDQKMNPAWT